MGFFSRKADELLEESTYCGRAAAETAKNGQRHISNIYKAMHDDTFQQWLDQTEKDWKSGRGRR